MEISNKEKKEIEEMAEIEKNKNIDIYDLGEIISNELKKLNVNSHYPLGHIIAIKVINAHYRPEAEVRAETVKEFAEKLKDEIAQIVNKPNIGETDEEYESTEDFKSGMNKAIEIIKELFEQYSKERA